jgi:membrane dipeptidase
MDCSHTGRLCSLDIMNASSQPVIFSHANPYTLVQHGRNVTDEQIRACAATGGVVCVSGLSFFLGSAQPTADDVARHAAYVADLVGVRTPASVWTSASPARPGRHATGRLRPIALVACLRRLQHGAAAHLHAAGSMARVAARTAQGRHERQRSGTGPGRNMMRVAQQVWNAPQPLAKAA